MDKIYINVEKKTRMISLTKTKIGNDLENLQQELVFKFTDEFVNGSARLEYKIDSNRYHIPMTKDGESYIVPIKNIITKEGKIEMQLVITQVAQDEEIPVFKSNVFYMFCDRSINAQEESPDDYEYWLDVIEEKLAEVDEALDELDNVDIDASKSGDTATISITNKEGITKSVEIYDGQTGAVGPQGPQGPQGPAGTTVYSELSDKPSINNVTLEGNKTSSDLGLQPAGNYVTNTDYATSSTGGIIKVSNGDYGLTVDEGVLKGTVKTYSQYSDASSKSVVTKGTLNNVITGKGLIDNTYHDSTKQDIEDNNLDTVHKTIPTAINEVNSIAKGANQALSYASYSAMVTAFNSLDSDEYNVGQNVYIVTTEVPDLWVSSVESTSSTYTYVDDTTVVNDLETNGYIQVGYYKLSMLETQKVDLTNYVTNTDYASNNTGGVVKTNTNYGTSVDSNGSLRGTTKTYADYDSMHSLGLISKVTLENVIEGKGLVSNTDYGSDTTAGVIKSSSTYGTQFASTGAMYARTKTYEQYTNSTSNGLFIGKGTLENIITGKGLVTNTDYATSATGGVIKTGASYGTTMASAGTLRAVAKTYEEYSSAGSSMFVGKGTLENVFIGKGLLPIVTLTQAEYDALATKDANTYYYIVEE